MFSASRCKLLRQLADGVDRAVLRANNDQPVGCSSRRGDRSPCFVSPALFSIGDAHAVKSAIFRTDDDRVTAGTVLLLRSLANKYDYQPFFLTLALFALSYAGLGISMYPYIVPQSITIWQAAAPENSQVFMLFGVAVLIPLILGYTVWAYWVFRGKVKPESGYH